jgi:hypothetical protein
MYWNTGAGLSFPVLSISDYLLLLLLGVVTLPIASLSIIPDM